MPVYANSEQLYENLKLLFARIQARDAGATQAVHTANLIIRFRCKDPQAEVVINGRTNPVQVAYGPTRLRPDLDVDLSADTLHHILMDELPLSKAVGSGAMKVRGPVWKTFVLEGVFRSGQTLYPELLRERGFSV